MCGKETADYLSPSKTSQKKKCSMLESSMNHHPKRQSSGKQNEIEIKSVTQYGDGQNIPLPSIQLNVNLLKYLSFAVSLQICSHTQL